MVIWTGEAPKMLQETRLYNHENTKRRYRLWKGKITLNGLPAVGFYLCDTLEKAKLWKEQKTGDHQKPGEERNT